MPAIGKLAMSGGFLALAGALAVPMARADGSFAQQERDPYLAMNKQLVAHGCHFCHGADYARVGPAMRDIATAYAPNGAAGVQQVKDAIVKGAKGHWGPAVMPAQTQVKPGDLDQLVNTIMATKDIKAK
ncbi:c-type cytochrome [Novosphingobium rosa]|uniref:c-type cytochrome n=1 Tax=Novosphingobium rosa TaxID=76978 RepID=UPI00082C6F25|nr:c-type cytochrome [Novosphingobium rosa]